MLRRSRRLLLLNQLLFSWIQCITIYLPVYASCKNLYKHSKNLIAHFGQHRLVSRIHGSTKRFLLPCTNQDVVQFIINFSNSHALSLLGRLPGLGDDKALLLSTLSYMSDHYIYGMSIAKFQELIMLLNRECESVESIFITHFMYETCHESLHVSNAIWILPS